ncbi:RNA polymerase factor sigma-54 [Neobacillus thermocopriae]|uniref:RNA polymerase factor sigma-54 n=1 Tax=Neobacillus thermocopriae TaxID=1215031 RepID=A0A6B3TNJ0_9BACI|nr:RNA polymerase factor sigma-54 [Neobacillus thermocopriae]MED3622812.1 RNA polymerase factor sigma-54 [Neobacillus thermocopriae]MED3714730.1 RNA polymerase factor sigma-54 [Neobacillus thermocopriae]NEX77347.1 RNA polymerase factor sigma-54 [Neobacillus thermocopriae]
MNLKAGLWQQQTLKLTMTQELTQAIALLQYSAQELAAFLENKALENPLLQIEHVNVRPMNPLIDRNRRKHEKAEKDWIEQIADRPFSWEEQLISQLNLKKLPAEQLKVIRHLINNLDENGYFTGDLNEIAQNLNVPVELVEDGLAVLQTLEPVGIGARNLQECLLIQIDYEFPDNDLAKKIVNDYFVPFAEKKWRPIAKELQVTLKEIQEIFDQIQLLNPKPGAILGREAAAYIIPDVIVEQTDEGWIVRMFDDPIPKISFNESYFHRFKDKDRQVSRFLQEKVQDYQWIIKSIEQRRETLTKVVTKIVERQSAFFQKGPQYLAPMTMKEIAAELDIHESTVSRAVREKYVQTPVGTFTLKSFFTSTIQTTAGDETTSSTQVKNAIRKLIEMENKQKPLSDQEIAEQLKAMEGMVVSRRTIAKYRDQLGIPSSTKRKRFN